jgi:hypothetical protein
LKIPEITEISRVTVKSGDRIIVRVCADLTEDQARVLKDRIVRGLRLPDSVHLIIVPDSIEFQVVAEDA